MLSAPNATGRTVRIDRSYNGGTSSAGTSGLDYSIALPYTASMLYFNTPGVYCSSTPREGFGGPNLQHKSLYQVFPGITSLAAGFTDRFAIFYKAIKNLGTVSVYVGLDRTGALLASFNLPYWPFSSAGASFAGVAQMVYLDDTGPLALDDLTFGSTVLGQPVPEPAVALGPLIAHLGHLRPVD